MFTIAIITLLSLTAVFGDTPANCTYEDISGKWTFFVSSRGHDKTLDCSKNSKTVSQISMNLYFPDVVVDEFGNKGFWTIIYNQGFEVVVAGRKYFAFSLFKQSGVTVTSMCDQTMNGWSHDIYDRDWACYYGKKATAVPPKTYQKVKSERLFKSNYDFINAINKHQKSWTATVYPDYEGKPMKEMLNRAGGPASQVHGSIKAAPVTWEQQRSADTLPDQFDWRNVEGSNYVSPVRNQESCGSCFAFASMAMNEARVRIMTNNSQQYVFSPQDIVECSEYSQGCEGGFPYLIGGKYAEDFGLVEESCNPYTGKDGECSTKPGCTRHYSTGYQYIGGFYGACNEALMRMAVFKNGPVAVGFNVTEDFFHYKSGIYHHTGLDDRYNPFEVTNHAVLVVGYGEDNGEKFWIVKNSWGGDWGEQGYFRIRRGTDELGIESMAVQSFPIV
ncbi:hypothetical protein SNE40_013386 [Patella caerulea]|uniref:dipeptidyl-peptidase I n=1 Tax=Patella caerulea TaxID=87958 RepID=A0AAN8PF65_PATCE